MALSSYCGSLVTHVLFTVHQRSLGETTYTCKTIVKASFLYYDATVDKFLGNTETNTHPTNFTGRANTV